MKSISFFKSLSWLIVLNLLIKPVWIFFIDRQVQNIVGYEEYGKYFAVYNLCYVLIFLADAGLSNMLNQHIAGNKILDVRQLFRIKFSMLFVYVAVCCFIAWLTHVPQWHILWYVIAIQALTSLFSFLRSIVTANQYFSTDAWLSVIDKLLMTIFCGSIIYTSLFGKINLFIFLRIQTFCTLLAVLLVLFFVLKKKLIVAAEKENIDRIVKWVTPFAIIILLMSVHYRLDGFLLERIHIHGAVEAGIYASAYRLLDAGNMIAYLAAAFLVPFIARHQNDKTVVEDAVLNTRHGLMFLSIGAVSFTIMFAPWIEQILYHLNDHYNSMVLKLCVVAMPAYFLVSIYSSILTAIKELRLFINILILSVTINIVLNLILIPSKGALGCCVAALCSQYFCGIITCIAATKKIKISFDVRSILIYLSTLVLLLGIFYFGKMFFINVWMTLFIAAVITIFILISQISFLKRNFISLR